MKRFIFIAIQLSLIAIAPLSAQKESDALHEINEIKLSSTYVWAEGTSRLSEKEAFDNAQTVLEFEIQNWLKTLDEKDVAGAAMPSVAQSSCIKTRRGKLFRSFVYVPKNLIVPYYKHEKLVVVESEASDTSEQAMPETPNQTLDSVYYEPTENEKAMLAVKTGNDMGEFFKTRHITRHGKFKNRPQSGSYYIFLYDRDSNILACLKSTDNVVTNVQTGQPDAFANYKDCFARWFIYE